jgi:hypothetical protein
MKTEPPNTIFHQIEWATEYAQSSIKKPSLFFAFHLQKRSLIQDFNSAFTLWAIAKFRLNAEAGIFGATTTFY